MKRILSVLLLVVNTVNAQKLKKADLAVIENLRSHISYLASDKLEGRRTGTPGEKLAYEYIGSEFTKSGLIPKGDKGTFIQEFEVNDGKMVGPASHLIIDNNELKLESHYFPLACSPDISLEAPAAIALQEVNSPWFFDIKDLLEENRNNPHFDISETIQTKANAVKKKGANALFIYNTSAIKDGLFFDGKSKPATTIIPVIYITAAAKAKYLSDETASHEIKLNISIQDKKRYGHNVIGYIDNGAVNTIIVGAHYDHLGYGEDNNSLAPAIVAIHNGADDNASGTAAIIEMSKILKVSKLKNNNYLFIAFSGEEAGLLGSKYFTENPTININSTNYMINLDMVGRVNDSTHRLFIGGYGTSPYWQDAINTKDKYFSIQLDSSGTGPSDHTSFYRKNIPVLFFFSGVNSDYHKPTDDADKINYTGELYVVKYIYSVIESLNKKGKIAFVKTREMQIGSPKGLKVTLGIMPDYAFSGSGVRVDGISEGRPAQKAGIKEGDILTQLGDHTFTNVETYMNALNKFNKGDTTTVTVKRGTEELRLTITF